MIIGIIPACGNATRMGGIAKFNLRIPKSDDTLIQFKKSALQRSHDFDIDKILPIYEMVYEEVILLKTKKAAEAALNA